MISFIDKILLPFYNIARNHERLGGSYYELFGVSTLYRKEFARIYDHDTECEKLESMPEPEKTELKNNSIKYCPADRLTWCKAVFYYEQLKKAESSETIKTT